MRSRLDTYYMSELFNSLTLFRYETKLNLKFCPHCSISVLRSKTKNFYLYSLLIFSWEENVVENWKCQALKIWKFNAEITSKNTWSYLIYSFHFLDFWLRGNLSSIWMLQKIIRTWPTSHTYLFTFLNSRVYLFLCLPQYNRIKNIENKLIIKQCKLHPAKK